MNGKEEALSFTHTHTHTPAPTLSQSHGTTVGEEQASWCPLYVQGMNAWWGEDLGNGRLSPSELPTGSKSSNCSVIWLSF